MGILTRLLNPDEQRGFNLSLADLDRMMDTVAVGGGSSATGRVVTEDTAMQLTAVLACVRLLSQTIASLPLVVYRRLPDDGKTRAQDHPLYWLLHNQPNPEMTAFEYRQAQLVSFLLWGDAYSEIQRYAYTGEAAALWPLRPDRMTPARINGELVYQYRLSDGSTKTFARNLILHHRNLTFNGINGTRPVVMGKEAIGLALATEEFGSRFFSNGARAGAVLQHPGVLSPEAHGRLRDSWELRHQGLSNSQRVAILEEGMTLETIGVPPETAQFLETRKFQVREIARLFGVPPHKIGDLDQATFSNIEQQAMEFNIDAIRPITENLEQRFESSLLAETDRQGYFISHIIDGLLRGDTITRYNAYNIGRNGGWLSVNDIRKMENMNPVEGGDEYLVPLNMSPAVEDPEDDPQDGAEEARSLPLHETATSRDDVQLRAATSRRRLATSYRRTLQHVAQRVVNREVNDIRNAAKRFLGGSMINVAGFEEWLEGFDPEHSKFVRQYLDPPLRTYVEVVATEVEREIGRDVRDDDIATFTDEYIQGRSNQWMANLMGDVRGALQRPTETRADMEPWNPLETIESELDTRAENQPDGFANEEAVRANNAIALQLYILAGIARKIWRSSGSENCPYCRHLNGSTVEVSKWFLPAGTGLDPGLPDVMVFTSASNIGHPPLHRGCDCMVVAG